MLLEEHSSSEQSEASRQLLRSHLNNSLRFFRAAPVRMTIFENLFLLEVDVDHVAVLLWRQGLTLDARQVFADHLARAEVNEEIHADIQDDRVVNGADEQIQGNDEIEQADSRDCLCP